MVFQFGKINGNGAGHVFHPLAPFCQLVQANQQHALSGNDFGVAHRANHITATALLKYRIKRKSSVGINGIE